ncbi:hypothetical protein Rsub_09376 [Raphidocelis subcapitata]|uniref:Uncharacterized protein n=1 Tax=Raphidocelis subcapitata TaxID=307507 RepID=A0A2V0PFG2_9CHLO|nr:hypothetical protein Rsub_09376 [Raphidocelis subcapitata]|eukprot:GBF96630.1 hypothetical protein Rsub_09376 [Raphidocelis subcapitata]
MQRRASRGPEARRGTLPRPRAAELLLAILIAAAGGVSSALEGPPADGAPPAPPHARSLPWRPAEWRYARGGEVEPPQDDARFWDRALLSASLGAANFEQMRPLLRKLRAGRPITVAAVGSSVVQDHGGTFHSSLEAVRAAVPSPHPYLYGSGPGSPGGPAWTASGWLTYFMRAVNATWPHADHLLVNAGRGGATPAAIADSMCVEASLPSEADLVVVENMGLVDAPTLERIARRLVQHYTTDRRARGGGGEGSSGGGSGSSGGGGGSSGGGGGGGSGGGAGGSGGRGSSSGGGGAQEDARPAVIFFNTARVAPDGWDCYYSYVPDCCATFRAASGEAMRAGRGDGPHHDLADYYGFGSISHGAAVWAMLRDRYASRLALPHGECELLARLHRDFVHPTGELGDVLFADYLVNYLSEAGRALFGESEAACPAAVGLAGSAAGRAGAAQFGPTGGPGGSSGDGGEEACAACPPPLPGGGGAAAPTLPLHASGWDVYHMRCYGSSSAANNFLAGRGDDGSYRARVVALAVLSASGFEFHEHQTHGDTRRLKPGWVATEPGSFLEVEVDADFGAALAADGKGGGGGVGNSSSGVGSSSSGAGSSSSVGGGESGGGGRGRSRQRGGGGSGEFVVPSRARARLFVETAYGAAALGAAEALASRLGGPGPAAAPGRAGTSAPRGRQPEGQILEMVVAFLTSYEHMGRARLSCSRGCGCEPRVVDAHHAERTSVSESAVLRLWPAPDGGGGGLRRCGLRVEVLGGTSSGEHKFKVIQVVTRARELAPPSAAGGTDAAASLAAAAAAGGGASGSGGGGHAGASRRRKRR